MVTRKRRTKIIATLGPATDEGNTLEQIIAAGVNMVRCNFSHGSVDDHKRRIEAVQACANKLDKHVGVMADLQGPKIRVANFKEGKVTLTKGKTFTLDTSLDADLGDETQVGVDYKQLHEDVRVGDELLLNDGLIVLKVSKLSGSKIECEVVVGGVLSNHKGINRKGGGLSAGALTDKDRSDLAAAAQLGIHYVAISFVRSAADIHETRELLKQANSDAGIIAKIERNEAVASIDEIINAADAVMVARGDLALEIGDAEVPAVQKEIIQRARELDKAAITATQMMESMITNPVPTRAEVSDVANAVLDGTDAVMLSAETAAGQYPVQTVEAMARVCKSLESHPQTQTSQHRLECHFERVDEAIAMATMYTANHMDIRAIITLTESGITALRMSRIRSGIPIYALSRSPMTLGRMSLYRGVYPVAFDILNIERVEVKRQAVAELQERGLVDEGDQVIITTGDRVGVEGRTNSMKIVTVGKVY